MAKNPIAKSSKSGGPQTEEAKKITSRNALKTGAYSTTLILPNEDEGEFRQMQEQFVRDFDPRDMAEITMVRDLAVLAWKKVRLENVELRHTLNRLARPLDHFEDHAFPILDSIQAKRFLSSPGLYTPEYQRELESASILADQMRERLSQGKLTEEELYALENTCPLISRVLVQEIDEANYINPTAKNVLRYTFINDQGDEQLFLDSVLNKSISYFQGELYIFTKIGEIEKQSKALQDQRLMALMENPVSSRAFDDLRRNFYRTLTELRKHQEWRRKMRAIDIADQSKTIEEGAKD